jgi:hypothetical protein
MIDDSGDRRFLLSSGPFSMALGDTQEVVVATLLGIGLSYLESVEVLKFNDRTVQDFYNDLVGYEIGTTDVPSSASLPEVFALMQNYPNPFNPTTVIEFSLAQADLVELAVFDLLGRRVATLLHEERKPGRHSVQWNAGGMASGVYYYSIKTGSRVAVRKAILIR